MGSFNVSCSLSGKSICCGDKAVLIPMTKNFIMRKEEDSDSIEFCPDHHIVYNGDCAPLAPVSMPLFGTYCDSGCIEIDNERNYGQEFTQSYWGVDLQSLANFVTYYDEDDESEESLLYKEFPNGLFGVWIHGDIWDEMIAAIDQINSIKKDIWPTPYILELLGFSLVGENKKDKRYNQTYKHPEIDGEVWSDGHFSRSSDDKNCSLHKVSDLVAWAAKHGHKLGTSELEAQGYSLTQIKSYLHEAKQSVDPFWREHYNELMKKKEDSPDLFSEEDERSLRLAAKYKDKRTHHNWRWMFCGYNIQYMEGAYAEQMEFGNEEVIEGISQLWAIKGAFYSCGRIMLPTAGGPQTGDAKYTLALGEALVKTSQDRLDQEAAWEAEYNK